MELGHEADGRGSAETTIPTPSEFEGEVQMNDFDFAYRLHIAACKCRGGRVQSS